MILELADVLDDAELLQTGSLLVDVGRLENERRVGAQMGGFAPQAFQFGRILHGGKTAESSRPVLFHE